MTNTLTISIWGREISLPVVFERCKGENATEEQIDALNSFASHVNYIEKAKKQVESYCKEFVEEDSNNQKKDNIFSYIKPEMIFVKREKDHPRIALMCQYRYDPENGLAIVFSKDGQFDVGPQDIIL